MWPWGHLAFGYLAYSSTRRLVGDSRVHGLEVVVLAVATQLPDLVDKPLAWAFDVVPTGYAVGHSVFVAVPVGVAVVAVALHRDRIEYGTAVLVGYWSHLVGDVLLAVALDQPATVERVLWPLVTLSDGRQSLGAVEHVGYYAVQFFELLATTESPVVVLAYLGPVTTALLFWVVDGAPGVAEVHDWLVRAD